MAKTGKTLFDQLREEAEASSSKPSLTTSPVVRYAIIVVACLLTTLLLPGTGGQLNSIQGKKTTLGTTWTDQTVIAEYSFPVPKDPIVLHDQREAAKKNSPDVFKALAKGRNQDLVADVKPNSGSNVVIVKGLEDADIFMDADKIVTLKSGSQATDTSVKLTVMFDSAATADVRNRAAASVASTQEIVRKSDVIVAKGQRVSEQILMRLSAYKLAQFARSDSPISLFVWIGSLIHAMVIIGVVLMYLITLRPQSMERNGQLGFLLLLPVITGLLGWVSVRLDTLFPVEYIIIVPAFSMIVSVLYDERTAIVSTLSMAMAVGAARGDDYAIAFILLVGGVFAVYSSRNVQSRTQIFTSIIAIVIGLVVSTVAIEFERDTVFAIVWPRMLMAAANGVLSPLVTFAVIIAIERAFNLATDMRLEDFENLNHHLLRQLNERAPGTYQHTLAVARLSDAAATAIDANALLARVGAYYHDIGKIEKSEYFVENQISIDNKHDRLTPKKSAAIIKQHVQDGIELAREYGLPERIAKFIPMHHGTVLIKHFYAKAVQEAQSKDIVVDENDFRYPGPKPDSKETGIVMLADAVEALSRLVDTSQREEIDAAVQSIILDRVTDGQLNLTPLTLNDLEIIRETFVKNLLASSHQRIAYKDVRDSADEQQS